MLGFGANRGIVPIVCEEIFRRITNKRQSDNDRQNYNDEQSDDGDYNEYEVEFSMLEIYNEKVQDLLIESSKRAVGGLKIREHKRVGVYVEGLSKHKVNSQ